MTRDELVAQDLEEEVECNCTGSTCYCGMTEDEIAEAMIEKEFEDAFAGLDAYGEPKYR